MATQSFLGSGWNFPPTFSQQGATADIVSDNEDIVQSLKILFGTRIGERALHEDFGCDLHFLLFQEINQDLHNRITGAISDAVSLYESRIHLIEIDVSQSEAQSGLLLISISYEVRATNSRYNLVYPFYINEAAIPVAI